MRIQVLYFEGCPHFSQAMDLIRSVAPNAPVEAIEINTEEDAVRTRFLGSPTVRVDGIDVEPAARIRADFAIACRIYGGSGVPSRELIASAIEHAAAGENAS